MAKTVEFFFDVGSPAAYLAHTQIPKLSGSTGASVLYRPMLLGGVFKAVGAASPANAKGRHMRDDFARFARRYGVPLMFNPFFPINTLQMMRMATAAQDEGILQEYLEAVFRGMWIEGRNMGDRAQLDAVLAAGGLDAERLAARAEEPAVKDRLKANTEEAVARGVFGAPTFFVGEEMFWGQDRLDFVAEAARS